MRVLSRDSVVMQKTVLRFVLLVQLNVFNSACGGLGMVTVLSRVSISFKTKPHISRLTIWVLVNIYINKK
jgi:hypothetical protein